LGWRRRFDPELVDHAEANNFVVVTVDTDFPMLIALHRATSPISVLLRGVNELAPDRHAALIIANLPAVADELQRGAIVSLGPATSECEASSRLTRSPRKAGVPQ
jgi:predicted nuclease of predicted toxin-antitoxin system